MKTVTRHLDENASFRADASPPDAVVILMHLGGPAATADIERFHVDLWSDPAVLPGLATQARRRKRAEQAFHAAQDDLLQAYARLGGGSPALELLSALALALENSLCGRPVMSFPAAGPARVLLALRHAAPGVTAAAQTAAALGARHVVGVSLYPLLDEKLAAACAGELEDACRAAGFSGRFSLAAPLHAHTLFRGALVERVRRTFDLIPPDVRGAAHLLFSVLSPPAARARKGPLLARAEELAQAVMKGVGLGEERAAAGFQNLGGPGRWLSPSLLDLVRERAASGVKALVVAPLSFAVDGLETLHELDNQLYMEAARAGVKQYRRVPALNGDPGLVGALASLVRQALPFELRGAERAEGAS